MNDSADPATILVIEDDPSLSGVLVATLRAAGYRPVAAASAAEGRRWYAHYAPDLVLLDLGLPDEDGLTVLESLRAQGATPVVVLSARGAETTKVRALDLGADDYITKPFGVDELLARIRAGLRHAVQMRGSTPVVRVGDLAVDMGLRRVLKAGEPVKLSPKEYDLLCELTLNLDRTVPHRELLRSVWGSEQRDIQYLRVYIGQLRQKLESPAGTPPRLLSEAGVGYRLSSQPG